MQDIVGGRNYGTEWGYEVDSEDIRIEAAPAELMLRRHKAATAIPSPVPVPVLSASDSRREAQ